MNRKRFCLGRRRTTLLRPFWHRSKTAMHGSLQLFWHLYVHSDKHYSTLNPTCKSYLVSEGHIQWDHLPECLQYSQTQLLMLPARLQHVICMRYQPTTQSHTASHASCSPSTCCLYEISIYNTVTHSFSCFLLAFNMLFVWDINLQYSHTQLLMLPARLQHVVCVRYQRVTI